MGVKALSQSGKIIGIDDFFSSHSEFSQNEELALETRHILKVLTRCDDPSLFAKRVKNGYTVLLDGVDRTYTLTFEIRTDAVVLTALH